MYSKELTIHNKTGLHARPAADFAGLAKKYHSKITVKKLDSPKAKAVNAKSIVMILSEGFSCHSRLLLTAEGEDENEAVEALARLLDSFTE